MSVKLNSVLISDEVDQKCVTILQENGIKVVKNTKLSKEELLKEIPVSNKFYSLLLCCEKCVQGEITRTCIGGFRSAPLCRER